MSVVLSTFRSALDRMKENPDFTFTASSAQFYEWVEDADTAALLCEWGVDFFQGALFGRAGPENAQAFRAPHV